MRKSETGTWPSGGPLPSDQVDKAVRLLLSGQDIVVRTDPDCPLRVLSKAEAAKLDRQSQPG